MTSPRRDDLTSGRQQRHEGASACVLAGKMEAVRRVLLLGEGNFSFAASLCGAAGTHVVATCYESEEEVCGRGRAAESIRRLREGGGSAPAGLGRAVGRKGGKGGRGGPRAKRRGRPGRGGTRSG